MKMLYECDEKAAKLFSFNVFFHLLKHTCICKGKKLQTAKFKKCNSTNWTNYILLKVTKFTKCTIWDFLWLFMLWCIYEESKYFDSILKQLITKNAIKISYKMLMCEIIKLCFQLYNQDIWLLLLSHIRSTELSFGFEWYKTGGK